MDGFLNQGWELILPGCGGTSALVRGATLAARWLHEPQPISNQAVGLEFPHRAGRYRPGGSPFSSPVVGVAAIWNNFRSGGETPSSPGATGR